MANPEHLAKLEEGAEAWNKWRNEKQENYSEIPDLSGASLRKRSFTGYELARTNLEGAGFFETYLEGLYLTGINLKKSALAATNLMNTQLSASNFEGASLTYCRLENAKLVGTNFTGARLNDVDLTNADLTEANLSGTHISESTLKGTILKQANFKGAKCDGLNFDGSDIAEANFENASLVKTNFSGVSLRSVNFSNADLRDSRGLRFDDTNIRHARLNPRPSNFFNRFFNPFFIYDTTTDPWSELRRAYTGPNFLLTLLALIGFLLPYIFQIATWRGINVAQGLIESTLTELKQEYQVLTAQGQIPASTSLSATINKLESLDPCLAETCKNYSIWQLLIGLHKGGWWVVLAIAIITYNLIRYNLTQTISAFREEEERSGYTPTLKEYFYANLFGVYPDEEKAPLWLRRLTGKDKTPLWLRTLARVIGLSPTRLHVLLKVLFLLAALAFLNNLRLALFTVVSLRP
jgi:uncharacterized protein YjbI with pentapeptide repeats